MFYQPYYLTVMILIFKVKSCVVKVSYLFVLTLSFSALEKTKTLFLFLVFSFLHEMCHILCLFVFDNSPQKINISFFGAGIVTYREMSFAKEVVFLLSGVVFNYLMCFVFQSNKTVFEVNLILGFVNSLPIFPLDGGRALKCMIEHFFDFEVGRNVFKTISVFTLVLLIVFSLYVFSVSKNMSLIFICLYLLCYLFNNSY